jgi:hypothetical protein
MELIACPECAEPAEIQREADLNGTDGPNRAREDPLRATAPVPHAVAGPAIHGPTRRILRGRHTYRFRSDGRIRMRSAALSRRLDKDEGHTL